MKSRKGEVPNYLFLWYGASSLEVFTASVYKFTTERRQTSLRNGF